MNHADITIRQIDVDALREMERRFLCQKCSELAIEVVALLEQNRALKIAGNKIANDLSNAFEVYEGSVTIKDIVEAWHKAKGEAE